MVDLAARALAEEESGLRVRARMVKSALESEARIVSMTFLPCLPVAPRTRMAFGVLMVGDVYIQAVGMWCVYGTNWKRRGTPSFK